MKVQKPDYQSYTPLKCVCAIAFAMDSITQSKISDKQKNEICNSLCSITWRIASMGYKEFQKSLLDEFETDSKGYFKYYRNLSYGVVELEQIVSTDEYDLEDDYHFHCIDIINGIRKHLKSLYISIRERQMSNDTA